MKKEGKLLSKAEKEKRAKQAVQMAALMEMGKIGFSVEWGVCPYRCLLSLLLLLLLLIHRSGGSTAKERRR